MPRWRCEEIRMAARRTCCGHGASSNFSKEGERRSMRLQEMTLRELRMTLIAPCETSNMVTEQRRIILVEVKVYGVTGWGECVAEENPGYSPETTETAWHILQDHL